MEASDENQRLSCYILLVEPAALFILLAAAAGAGIVAADSWLIAAKRLMQQPAIDEGPGSVLFAECGNLVVLDLLILLRIRSDELDGSFGIRFLSTRRFEYLEASPLGSFGPFARAFAVEVSPGAGMEGSFNEVDVCRNVCRIPRTHQGLCRGGIREAFEKRFTALIEGFVASAVAMGHLLFLS